MATKKDPMLIWLETLLFKTFRLEKEGKITSEFGKKIVRALFAAHNKRND